METQQVNFSVSHLKTETNGLEFHFIAKSYTLINDCIREIRFSITFTTKGLRVNLKSIKVDITLTECTIAVASFSLQQKGLSSIKTFLLEKIKNKQIMKL